MSTLIIELPDAHISVLERVAYERGTSIDAVIADLVTTIEGQGFQLNQAESLRDTQHNMVQYLLEHPYHMDEFVPLTRDELYERG